jgi:hypothetical protein
MLAAGFFVQCSESHSINKDDVSSTKVRYKIWVSIQSKVLSPYFQTFMKPRNRFQGMNSASLCILAGRYDNPIPPRVPSPHRYFNNSSSSMYLDRKEKVKTTIYIVFSIRVIVGHTARLFIRPFFHLDDVINSLVRFPEVDDGRL